MNLQALTERAANGEIREFELLSLEGGLYLARVGLDQDQFTLLDDEAKPMRLRSINHLRDMLHVCPAIPLRACAAVRP